MNHKNSTETKKLKNILMTEHEKFKALTNRLGLSYQDIADKLDLKYDSVKNQLAPAKPLPRWAKAMIVVEENYLAFLLNR
jgi:hypothetical protein